MCIRDSLWSVAVLVACSIPGDQLVTPPFELLSSDKLAHVVLFAGVGGLWTWARPDRVGLVLLGGVLFGVGIEVWQGLLPIGRSPEAADAVADAVGLVLGVGLGRAFARTG